MKLAILIFSMGLTINANANFTDFSETGSSAAQNLPGIINQSKVDEIVCEGNYTIKDHMARMGFIIRNLRELVNDLIDGSSADELKAVVMIDSQVLRTHLIAVLPQTPTKIKNIDIDNLQKNKLIFQRYLLKMISYTIDIEEALLVRPITPDEIAAQRLKIANSIIRIDETVQEAHNLFRF